MKQNKIFSLRFLKQYCRGSPETSQYTEVKGLLSSATLTKPLYGLQIKKNSEGTTYCFLSNNRAVLEWKHCFVIVRRDTRLDERRAILFLKFILLVKQSICISPKNTMMRSLMPHLVFCCFELYKQRERKHILDPLNGNDASNSIQRLFISFICFTLERKKMLLVSLEAD